MQPDQTRGHARAHIRTPPSLRKRLLARWVSDSLAAIAPSPDPWYIRLSCSGRGVSICPSSGTEKLCRPCQLFLAGRIARLVRPRASEWMCYPSTNWAPIDCHASPVPSTVGSSENHHERTLSRAESGKVELTHNMFLATLRLVYISGTTLRHDIAG